MSSTQQDLEDQQRKNCSLLIQRCDKDTKLEGAAASEKPPCDQTQKQQGATAPEKRITRSQSISNYSTNSINTGNNSDPQDRLNLNDISPRQSDQTGPVTRSRDRQVKQKASSEKETPQSKPKSKPKRAVTNKPVQHIANTTARIATHSQTSDSDSDTYSTPTATPLKHPNISSIAQTLCPKTQQDKLNSQSTYIKELKQEVVTLEQENKNHKIRSSELVEEIKSLTDKLQLKNLESETEQRLNEKEYIRLEKKFREVSDLKEKVENDLELLRKYSSDQRHKATRAQESINRLEDEITGHKVEFLKQTSEHKAQITQINSEVDKSHRQLFAASLSYEQKTEELEADHKLIIEDLEKSHVKRQNSFSEVLQTCRNESDTLERSKHDRSTELHKIHESQLKAIRESKLNLTKALCKEQARNTALINTIQQNTNEFEARIEALKRTHEDTIRLYETELTRAKCNILEAYKRGNTSPKLSSEATTSDSQLSSSQEVEGACSSLIVLSTSNLNSTHNSVSWNEEVRLNNQLEIHGFLQNSSDQNTQRRVRRQTHNQTSKDTPTLKHARNSPNKELTQNQLTLRKTLPLDLELGENHEFEYDEYQNSPSFESDIQEGDDTPTAIQNALNSARVNTTQYQEEQGFNPDFKDQLQPFHPGAHRLFFENGVLNTPIQTQNKPLITHNQDQPFARVTPFRPTPIRRNNHTVQTPPPPINAHAAGPIGGQPPATPAHGANAIQNTAATPPTPIIANPPTPPGLAGVLELIAGAPGPPGHAHYPAHAAPAVYIPHPAHIPHAPHAPHTTLTQ